jgi:hypothetical protein
MRNVVGRACNPRFGVSRKKLWDRRIMCLQEAYWTLKWALTGGCEKIWITYPSVMEDTDEYIRPQVLIELGGRNVIDPNEIHTVSPYIAELTEGPVYPSGEVVVLSPERTFWEKATLIHVECNRGELRASAERLSGHWYDLVILAKHPAGRLAIENRQIFRIILIYYKKGSCLACSHSPDYEMKIR